MKKEMINIEDVLETSKGAHILYCIKQTERYIDNAASFIVAGIKQGDHILIVESERLYPKILKRVKESVSKDQLANIHYVNNFTFYWKNGNFHPPTILSYFADLITPFLEEKLSFRTWGHVEWRDELEIIKDIEEYERGIEQLMPETKAVSVCAYDAARVSAELQEVLINCHGFLMTDESISPIAKDVE